MKRGCAEKLSSSKIQSLSLDTSCCLQAHIIRSTAKNVRLGIKCIVY